MDPSEVILFGGTFEPPHIGHLMLARLALEQTDASEVWMIPSLSPPHKDAVILDYIARKEMTEALVEGTPGLRVVGLEEDLPQPSYTLTTIQAFQEKYPDTHFIFLMGGDSLAALPTWYRSGELAGRISFLVAARTGFPFAETYREVRQDLPNLQAKVLEMPIVDLSSTWLRQRLQAGSPLFGLVPDGVLEIWRRHMLEYDRD